jgi:hypothetical protein
MPSSSAASASSVLWFNGVRNRRLRRFGGPAGASCQQGKRVQAFTDVENVAERRALENVGFVQEGVLRSAQWRQGSWHDQILYSIVRDRERK